MKKVLLVLALVLSACSGQPGPTLTLLPSPQASAATSTPAEATASTAQPTLRPVVLPTPAEPAPLTITALDGAKLAASYYAPVQPVGEAKRAPGVLLVHMLGGCACRKDWDAFARSLQKRGIAALALDLRGRGESAGPEDWGRSPGDVRAAWDALVARPDVDGEHSAIVGASIGANLALIVGANNAGVAAVAALSPGIEYHGVRPMGVLGNFGQRPVLLVASQDDGYSYDSVRQMAAQTASGASGLETYYLAKAGHGTDMFRDPSLEPLLMDWLQKNLGILKG